MSPAHFKPLKRGQRENEELKPSVFLLTTVAAVARNKVDESCETEAKQ